MHEWEAERSDLGQVIAKFKAKPTLIQSFEVTRSHIVIPLYPLTYATGDQPSVFKDGCKIEGLYDRLQYNAGDDTLFYVISRERQCLAAVYRSEASFAFNTVNAFESEDGNTLCLDVCSYEDDLILGALELTRLRSARPRHRLPTPTLKRYVLEGLREESAAFYAVAGQLPVFPTAKFHVLTSRPLEFPLVNPGWNGRQASFIWGLSMRRSDEGHPGLFWNAIVKMDPLYPHDQLEWSQPGCFPSPPLFIQEPNEIREDCGVLMTTVLDVLRKRSFLLVLSADSLEVLGKFWLPTAVPPSYHSGSAWLQGLAGPDTLPEARLE